MSEPAGQIAATLRAADRDRYLSVLYAPEGKRDALFSLYAFNAEIAAIRDRIREALPGEIRLQWWRDVLAASEGAGEGHPVAAALVETIRLHNLPRSAFHNYLEARIFDLYDDPMPSRVDLEGYCGETASAIIQLAALILDPAAAPAHTKLAGHAGCALAITGLLRLLPIHRARGQCYVPRDILASAGMSPEEFLAGAPDGPARHAVEATIALASDHLAAFLKNAPDLPPGLRPAFLPLAVVPAYLSKLSRNPAAALETSAGISDLRRHWIMLRAASSGWR
ncbi:phytoene/squalene synthase family protein [Mesorhizobium sp. L-8-3]|uniref:phytoene/squalene synthase family protein n=1 Tax=Mesorhizobium sp. L-8-3 TaxID=2744522 RepID=UPI0019286BD0|nr:phytoene/squalene synthase family protein [Mesorhizobium sp. L-8-3]BCH25222.1 phytoene synthase [Mesorhizobium sp. L-8-3]